MKKMIKPLILAALFAVIMLSVAFSQTTVGKVIQIHDGDSYLIQFSQDSSDYIRLAGCDAPEVYSPYVTRDQPGGRVSAQVVRDNLKGKEVLVEFLRYDKFGRPVCNIYEQSIGDLAYYLVSNGHAWWLDLSVSNDKLHALKQAQSVAKEYKRGFWGLEGRKIRPSTWRSWNKGL